MLNRARLGRNAKVRLFDLTLTHKRYDDKSGVDMGIPDWTSFTTLATVRGHKQQASAQAQMNAGLEVLDSRWVIFAEPLSLSPNTDRLNDGTNDYQISTILWSDASHIQVIGTIV
jgi:hypothetical protein